jgi:Leucine-rich repeat (LRR) protein
LDLYGIPKVDSLPDNIPVNAKLQSLVIYNSGLTSLPDTIGRLSDLTNLQVSYAKLKHFPDQTSQLSSLRVLELVRCMDGPLVLRHGLTALERVVIEGIYAGHVLDLGALATCANLQSLSIGETKKATCSIEFAAQNRLTSLEIRNCSPLAELSASLRSLSQLRQLKLELVDFPLRRLSDETSGLTALTALEIDYWDDVNTEVITSLTNLRRVTLSYSLPTTLATLSNLVELRIPHLDDASDMNALADIARLTNLTLLELGIKGPETKWYPKRLSLPRLQEVILDMSDDINKAAAKRVSKMLAHATSIRTAEIISNSEEQPPLSPVIAALPNLRNLRLAFRCDEIHMPETLTSLSKLTSLSLTNAGYTYHEDNNLDVVFSLTTLRHLALDMDLPGRLPDHVTRLQQLRRFKIPRDMNLCEQVTRLRRLHRIEGYVRVDDEENTVAAAALARRGVQLIRRYWSH